MHDRSHKYCTTKVDRAGWRRATALLFACFIFGSLVSLSSHRLEAQATPPPPIGIRTDRVDMPSPINQLPDANAQIRSNHKHSNQNFDAANAVRQRQIADETTKLLILARDVKAEMERLGADPLPAKLVREMELIEVLAHDVQEKMVLAPRPG